MMPVYWQKWRSPLQYLHYENIKASTELHTLIVVRASIGTRGKNNPASCVMQQIVEAERLYSLSKKGQLLSFLLCSSRDVSTVSSHEVDLDQA